MKKIILSLICFLSIANVAFAQNIGIDDVIAPPGGAPSLNETDVTHPPGGPAVLSPDDVTAPPTVYGRPDNAIPPQTVTGSFLRIDTPASHGLPGGSAESMIGSVLSNLLNFIALVGIFGLIFAGLQLWISQGKADSIGTAKVNIFNLIIGFAIVLLSWSAVTIILRYLGF